MIAITVALPEESKGFRREMEEAKHAGDTLAGPILTGLLRGTQVVLCHTGVGCEAAFRTSEELLQRFKPKQVISSGFAGALDSALEIGDVVYDPRGEQSTDLDELLPRCFCGAITTQGHAIETPEEKARLRRETGAIAVDMETDAIARACTTAKVPLIGIRGVSDRAADPLPVPMAHWFDLERQKARPLRLIRYLAANPGRIRGFAAFVKGLPKAREAMTEAVIVFIEQGGP